MKKTILLTSVMTIVLCVCLIAGSTFALFTDQETSKITVTSGNVDIAASITDLKADSIQSVAAGTTGAITFTDPLLGDVSYVYPGWTDAVNNEAGFANGGSAIYNKTENVLKISKITPGDKVQFTIDRENNSDVNIKSRITFNLDENSTDADRFMMKGLIFTVQIGNTITEYTNLDSFATEWEEIIYDITTYEDVVITIELPAEAGNEYQDHKIKEAYPNDNYDGISIIVQVEAVQANGVQ